MSRTPKSRPAIPPAFAAGHVPPMAESAGPISPGTNLASATRSLSLSSASFGLNFHAGSLPPGNFPSGNPAKAKPPTSVSSKRRARRRDSSGSAPYVSPNSRANLRLSSSLPGPLFPPAAGSTFKKPHEEAKLDFAVVHNYPPLPTSLPPPLPRKTSRRPGPNNNGFDDENNDYIIEFDEVWDCRYTVMGKLGKGSFGQVVEAWDAHKREYVAIKIIKNKSAFTKQALVEERILNVLAKRQREMTPSTSGKHIVKFFRSFRHHSHLCLVYELLGCNLYELLRLTNFQGLGLALVRTFASQLLVGLQFLSSNGGLKVLHCDLKPENILIQDPAKNRIKIIDFGSSCFENERTYHYIQSRFYRSPEVLLGLQYGVSIDIWSLGCVLVELLTGEPLFPGKNEAEMISGMTELLGVPPNTLLARACPTASLIARAPRGTIWGNKQEKVVKWFTRIVDGDGIVDQFESGSELEFLCEDSEEDNGEDGDSRGLSARPESNLELANNLSWNCVAPSPNRSRQQENSCAWGGRSRNLWGIVRKKMEEKSFQVCFEANETSPGAGLKQVETFGPSGSSGEMASNRRSIATMTPNFSTAFINPVRSSQAYLAAPLNCGREIEQVGETACDYKNFFHLITRMLEYDPNRRIGPSEALRSNFFATRRNHGTQTLSDVYI